MSEPRPSYDIVPALAQSPAETALDAARPQHTERDVLDVWLDTKMSRRTRAEYRKIIVEALDYLGGLARVSRATLAHYHGTLMQAIEDGALSTSTVATRLSALRGFLAFAGVPSGVVESTLKRPSVGVEKPYNVVSDDEIALLMSACTSTRDRVIICLLRETGVRCNELCNIKVTDLSANDVGILVLRVRKGKGNKMRSVPLSRRAVDAITGLLNETSRVIGRDDTYLFQSRTGGKLATSRVRQILIDARQVAGIAKRASAHSFRHTAAVRWIRKGGKINEVGELMGHSSPITTGRYLKHVELDDLAKIVDA